MEDWVSDVKDWADGEEIISFVSTEFQTLGDKIL